MGWGRNRRTAHDQYSSLHHSTAFTACLFTMRLFFAVPSSVPTSEGLFSSRSSRHSYLRPRPRGPLEDTSDRWWAAITRRHVLHSCRVTSLVFNSTCSDSTYAGHHLLRPLLTTMLVLKKQIIKPHNPFRCEMSG